ncbi:MAG: hypothetical protein MZU95_01370 [Desulfomicrobium escambiense]|nr:hypothetical protein [Desulfomicrobium escambiense]
MANRGGERSTNENVTKDGRTIFCEWYNTSLVTSPGKVIGVASRPGRHRALPDGDGPARQRGALPPARRLDPGPHHPDGPVRERPVRQRSRQPDVRGRRPGGPDRPERLRFRRSARTGRGPSSPRGACSTRRSGPRRPAWSSSPGARPRSRSTAPSSATRRGTPTASSISAGTSPSASGPRRTSGRPDQAAVDPEGFDRFAVVGHRDAGPLHGRPPGAAPPAWPGPSPARWASPRKAWRPSRSPGSSATSASSMCPPRS